jgi:hypothetical protein
MIFDPVMHDFVPTDRTAPRTAARNADEDLMTLKFPSLGLCLGLSLGSVLGLTLAVVATDAGAQSPPTVTKRQAAAGGPVSYSYMSGPHTRVYVTKRSWLDAGTEVLPGDRKFTDYATGGPNQGESLARLNSHLDQRRSLLSTPSDLGGYPTGFPLPPY